MSGSKMNEVGCGKANRWRKEKRRVESTVCVGVGRRACAAYAEKDETLYDSYREMKAPREETEMQLQQADLLGAWSH